MREYLNNGRLIKESVDRRDTRYLAMCPNSFFEECMTLLLARTPEYKLNFSFSYTKTHTYSCMRADVFSGVF